MTAHTRTLTTGAHSVRRGQMKFPTHPTRYSQYHRSPLSAGVGSHLMLLEELWAEFGTFAKKAHSGAFTQEVAEDMTYHHHQCNARYGATNTIYLHYRRYRAAFLNSTTHPIDKNAQRLSPPHHRLRNDGTSSTPGRTMSYGRIGSW